MKYIRILKSSKLEDELLNESNWESQPSFSKDGHVFRLKGNYNTKIIKRIPGDSGERRLFTEDYKRLGNWTEETTQKYIEKAKKEGIINPIIIKISNNNVKVYEGNHRKELAYYLKLKTVPIEVWCWDTELPTKNYFGILNYIK